MEFLSQHTRILEVEREIKLVQNQKSAACIVEYEVALIG